MSKLIIKYTAMSLEVLQQVIDRLQLKVTPDVFKERLLLFIPEPPVHPPHTQLPVSSSVHTTPVQGFAISGRINSGKSTIASFLQTKGYRLTSMATPLKDICAWLYQLDRQLLEGDTSISREWRETYCKKIQMTPRQLLQVFGTEVCRYFDPRVWASFFERHEAYGKIVIADARFLEELELAQRLGLKTIHVVRSMAFLKSLHASETTHETWAHFDYEIANNNSLESLEKNISKLISEA